MYAAEGPGYGVWGGPAREAAAAGEAAAAEATARAAAEGASRGGTEPRGRGYYCFPTRAAARACFEALAAGEAAAGESAAGEGGDARGEGGCAAVAVTAATAAASAAPSQQQAITRLVEGTVEQAAKRPAAVGAAGGEVEQVELAEQAAADTAAAERAAAEAKAATERLKVVQKRTAEEAASGRDHWMQYRPGKFQDLGEAAPNSAEKEGAASLAVVPAVASEAVVAASVGGKARAQGQSPASGSRPPLPLGADDIEETDVEDEDEIEEEIEEEEEEEIEDEGFEEGGGEEGPEGDQDAQEQRQRSGGGSGLALFGFGAGRHGVSQQAHGMYVHGTCMHAWHVHGMAHAWHVNGVSQQARSQAAAALDAALQGHMAPDEAKARRPRTPWSRDEVAALELGVSTLGEGHWGVILERYAARFHSRRTDVDLKDKWRNLQRAAGH